MTCLNSTQSQSAFRPNFARSLPRSAGRRCSTASERGATRSFPWHHRSRSWGWAASDRILDSGGVNAFEVSLASGLGTRHVLPGLQRRLFSESLRERTKEAFDATAALAAERGGLPKFVFTHVMSPHAPVLWGSGGRENRRLGVLSRELQPLGTGSAGRVDAHADRRTGRGTRIDSLSTRSLGSRHVAHVPRSSSCSPIMDTGTDYDDHDEMLRSLFLTNTPGRVGLFPNERDPGEPARSPPERLSRGRPPTCHRGNRTWWICTP